MTVATTRVAIDEGYSIARILNGGWQLAAGHRTSPVDVGEAIADLTRLAEAGFTSFDCADIYTGVEELLGRFLESYPRPQEIQIHTKLVPDRAALAALDRRYVEGVVDRSLQRLGVERLDLVQLHWWDYEVPGLVETAGWLAELREKGKVRLLGATNCDTAHLRQILEAGIPLATHQVQYSLLDQRPQAEMTSLCAEHSVKLLCYGSLAGGFLSDSYLGCGKPPATPKNRSLIKYALIIEEFGGWELYQELLAAARKVATKHDTSVANVAVRWVLDQEAVAAAIVGARSAEHVASNLRTFALTLDEEDRACLDAVLTRSHGPQGDVYELERVRRGRHALIMKTDLNRLE
jgi:aryl-alcohol dehydrogenase-like predicted oxidoreductase